MRAASNRAEFINAVSEACGVRIEVVSGYEEAEMALLGACPGGTATVVDIGGASVEIVCGDEGKVTYAKSLPLGMVRLTEQADGNAEMLRAYAATGLAKYGDVPSRGETVGRGRHVHVARGNGSGAGNIRSRRRAGLCADERKGGRACRRADHSGHARKHRREISASAEDEVRLIKAGAVFVCELNGLSPHLRREGERSGQSRRILQIQASGRRIRRHGAVSRSDPGFFYTGICAMGIEIAEKLCYTVTESYCNGRLGIRRSICGK